MTNDDIRQLCQTLRAEGVRRARLDAGVPVELEFFEQAAALPTDAERAIAGAEKATGEQRTGHERALDILRTGMLPQGGDA